MKIQSGSVNINAEQFNSFDSTKPTVLMLHGFTGSLEDWRDVSSSLDTRFNYIGIDHIGHGKSDSPSGVSNYEPDASVKYIDDVLRTFSLKQVIIIGYSMGGRAALCYAASNPEKLMGLILESASAGFENKNEREERINSDEELAKFIETHTLEQFAELWMDKEIFNTQRRFSNQKLEKIKKDKSKNSKTGLANTLRGFGTGKMPVMNNELKTIQCPVLLITGRLDTKFTKINARLINKFPKAKHSVILTAGHNTHLEEPKKFVDIVNIFLRNF